MAALALPILLLVIAGGMGALPCDPGEGCARSATRLLYLLTIAAPTLPVASVVLGFLPDVLTLVAGVAASLPLWSAVGAAVARRVIRDTRTPVGWAPFWRRYLAFCGVWVVIAVALITVYARVSG